MMKKIFREKNLPEELFYLALIESGYNPQATSRAKAGGIWQFLVRPPNVLASKWISGWMSAGPRKIYLRRS